MNPKLTMLPLALLAQVGKRVGLGRQMVRLMIRQLRSREAKQRAFAGYPPTEHDVFVATFGKSGTNWMMQIAQQIAHRGEAEFRHIHDLVPWPDAPGPAADVVALLDAAPRERSPTGLRVIKTHLEAEFVPYDEKSAYLTVLRDPKEVLVSSYYFLGGLLGVLDYVSIDSWFDLFMEPDSMATAWARHTASFWDWRNRPNVVVLPYREVKQAPGAAIERVAAVMGVELSETQISKVMERSSFEYMKAHESQFAPPRLPLMKESDRPLMVRRGRAGVSGEQLSPAQQARVDRLCHAELGRIGSDFPYASTFDMVPDRAV
jgi:hypothetical protein